MLLLSHLRQRVNDSLGSCFATNRYGLSTGKNNLESRIRPAQVVIRFLKCTSSIYERDERYVDRISQAPEDPRAECLRGCVHRGKTSGCVHRGKRGKHETPV